MSEVAEVTREVLGESGWCQLTEPLAAALRGGIVVYLLGNLGAGKTTFVRQLLRDCGYSGRVTSPSYSLVETYQLEGFRLNHLDLYRLTDPEELEFLGVREQLGDEDCLVVEWPQRGRGVLPEADLIVKLSGLGASRTAILSSVSTAGEQLLHAIRVESTPET